MDPGHPNDPSGTPGAGSGPDPNQPGWAVPTPPSQSPPPAPVPPPKRRMTWLWILIPTLLLFAVATVVVIVFAIRLVVGPIEATDDYFALIRDGRYASAYGERCDSFKAQVSLDEFVNRERVAGPVGDFDIDEFDIDDGDATTEGTVERGGDVYDVTVQLERDDGDWKVCEIAARA